MVVMKITAFAALALFATLSASLAQTAVTETVTTAPVQAAGTITTFEPTGNSIIISGPNNAAPVTYGYSKSTTIVDEAGNPVAVEVVKTGVPVTVYYTSAGGQSVASKVVVHRTAPAVKETTTTTTTTEVP